MGDPERAHDLEDAADQQPRADQQYQRERAGKGVEDRDRARNDTQHATQKFDPARAAGQGRYSGDDRENAVDRSEEHTSELQSLMRISYAVFRLKKTKPPTTNPSRSPAERQSRK